MCAWRIALWLHRSLTLLFHQENSKLRFLSWINKELTILSNHYILKNSVPDRPTPENSDANIPYARFDSGTTNKLYDESRYKMARPI